MGGHSTDEQLANSMFSPTANAIAEHQESEDLATVFRHKSRVTSSQYHGDYRGDTEKFVEIFGGLSLIAIQVDDTPLWQVPVKVSLYDSLVDHSADMRI